MTVSLPLIAPALLFSAVLVFFLGFELFGLPLVLGDPEGHLVLSTYLYKLTNKLGTPSYHLMAAVADLHRRDDVPARCCCSGSCCRTRGDTRRSRARPAACATCRSASGSGSPSAIIGALAVRRRDRPAFRHRAARIRHQLGLSALNLAEVFTFDTFPRGARRADATCARSGTPMLIGTVGGAVTVACYTAIGFATHRRNDGWSRFVDYLVLVPRAVPGLLAGLAFLWVFLFFPPLAPLRTTIFSMWLAYTVVWLAYGMRLISSSLLQVSRPSWRKPRAASARRRGRISREITLPLIRHGLLAIVAARVHDLRARILDRRLPARAGHRGHRRAARFAVAGRRDRRGRRAVADQRRAGRFIGLALALRFGVKLRD